MKRKAIKKVISAFNMIEIVLAMAIIAFGMTSILGLFPVGINASQNAIANNCGSDAVEQFMGYLKSYAEIPATTNFATLFGTSSATGLLKEKDQIPGVSDLDTLRSTAADVESNLFLTALRTNPAAPAAPYSKITGWQMYRSNQPAIYFVTQGEENAFPSDFAAMIIAWKQPISTNLTLGTWRLIPDNAYTQGAGLNMEISWPLEKSYADREKRCYYIEIKKP